MTLLMGCMLQIGPVSICVSGCGQKPLDRRRSIIEIYVFGQNFPDANMGWFIKKPISNIRSNIYKKNQID